MRICVPAAAIPGGTASLFTYLLCPSVDVWCQGQVWLHSCQSRGVMWQQSHTCSPWCHLLVLPCGEDCSHLKASNIQCHLLTTQKQLYLPTLCPNATTWQHKHNFCGPVVSQCHQMAVWLCQVSCTIGVFPASRRPCGYTCFHACLVPVPWCGSTATMW